MREGVPGNRVIRFIALVFAIFLGSASMLEQNQVYRSRNVYGAYYDILQEGESLRVFEEEQKEQGNQTAAWREEDSLFVNEDTGRTASGTVFEILGSQELVFPEMLCQGSYPVSEDDTGCMISSKLAETLFGSGQVLGAEIRIGEKICTIRGILKSSRLLASISGGSRESYDRLLLKNTDSAMTASGVQNIFYSSLGNYPAVFVEGGLYSALARLFCMLPVWLAFGLLLILIRRRKGRGRWIVVAFAIVAAEKLAAFTFLFSADYLPSMWSDFSFWSSLFLEKLHDIQKLQRQVPSLRDVQMLKHMRNVILLSAGASISLLFWSIGSASFGHDRNERRHTDGNRDKNAE